MPDGACGVAGQTEVSILLTTLNGARHVARSIQSCLHQTHRDLELIIVDGGSTDGTLDVVAGFDDPRIRVIHQEGNAGKLPGAINLGMAASRGAFITWTQDDCWYELDAIATMLRFLDDRPEVGLVYADYWDVDAAGRVLRYQRVNDPEAMTRDLRDDVVRQCFLFRREVYEVIGPQETRYFPVHEVPWRLRVAERFRLAPLHVPLMSYMVHDASLTGRIGAWELQRLFAGVARDAGLLDRRAQRRRLAEIDLDEAHEAFVLQGDFGAFRRLAFRAIRRSPRSALDRGLGKLLLASFLPLRKRYQASLEAGWRARDAATQRELVEQLAPANPTPDLR